uniref:YihY/virulence factor BrkB family protein n=1 Tax=uncultured Eudoraea sp. TaxID=1035614 RepID=UPI002636EF09
LLRVRLIALALLVSISFLMAVFLILDAAVTGLAGTLVELLGEMAVYLVAFDAIVLDVCASTALFALYFRFLPDITLAWRDIWLGALLTALLFAVGKSVISRLIGNSDAADLYDAAGSILVLMLWVYYAAAMFLFGATFTFARVRLGEYTSLSGRLES